MPRELPLLPTTVVGSHAPPSWLCHVRQHLDAFGPTDRDEAYDDAVPGPITLLMPLRRGGPRR